MDRRAPAALRDGRPATAGTDTTTDAHERRREMRRRPGRGSVCLDGVEYELFDWSSSGVCAHGYDGPLVVGDRTRASIMVSLPKQVLAFECDLILVRVDREAKLAAGVFAGLSREDRVSVASYFEAVEAEADAGLRAANAAR